MDRSVSDQHGGDERDGILLSAPRRYASDHRRNYLAGLAGSCDPRALCASPCWTLALDLCGLRDDRTLLECLRPGRATLSEGASAESFGAYAVRAAIRGHATCGAGAIFGADDHRRDQVSWRTTSDGLI